jgi:hypothetical protein
VSKNNCLLNVDSLNDEVLKKLLMTYRFTQIIEDKEYDLGQSSRLNSVIDSAKNAEHNLVEYLKHKLKI